MKTEIPTTGDPAAKLLSRLESVRQFGPGRWMARCPAHDDKNPSLSIKETDDGGILLVKCWAGCNAAEIVAAVGLNLSDLFPRPPERPHTLGARTPWRDAAGDAFRALADEVDIIWIAGATLSQGVALSDVDQERLALAVSRVRDALDMIGGGRGRG